MIWNEWGRTRSWHILGETPAFARESTVNLSRDSQSPDIQSHKPPIHSHVGPRPVKQVLVTRTYRRIVSFQRYNFSSPRFMLSSHDLCRLSHSEQAMLSYRHVNFHRLLHSLEAQQMSLFVDHE